MTSTSATNPQDLPMLQQLRGWRAGEIKPAELFYDWFCSDASLPKRGARLMSKAAQLVTSPIFDASKVYLFFKNNAPLSGGTYDDFRICELGSGDVLYTISNDPRYDLPWQVWDVRAMQAEDRASAYEPTECDWAGVLAFFKVA